MWRRPLAKADDGSAWRKVARLADLPVGGVHRASLDGLPIVLCRIEAGVFALTDRCSHAGWPLSEGRVRGETLVCPYHGARFSLKDGTPLAGPAREPVQCHSVRIEGDDILIAKAP